MYRVTWCTYLLVCEPRIAFSCDNPFIFFIVFFLYKHKTSRHNGTTIFRLANIWHMPHNMYLIIRVISNSEKHNSTIIISAEKYN